MAGEGVRGSNGEPGNAQPCRPGAADEGAPVLLRDRGKLPPTPVTATLACPLLPLCRTACCAPVLSSGRCPSNGTSVHICLEPL